MATAGRVARAHAKEYLQSALETGVRGELREAIKQALKIAVGRRVTTLTDLEYRQLAIGGKLVDPDRPGLLMRHGKRTGKIWIYRFEHPETGKQRELQFGRYPEMGLADARETWSRLRVQRRAGQVPLVGGDEVDAAGPQVALGELCRRYVHEYARKVKRSWAEDERLLTRHILPHYTDLPVAEFDHEKVASILHSIHERGAPREAEKLRACLQTLFNVATGRTRKISTLGGTWLPPDFVNPVSSVMLPRRAPKSHKPSRAELRSYVQGLGDLGEVGEVLRVQIETMSRIGEIAGMRWDELDLDAGTWTLPAARSKNGKTHIVMLARQTLERLQARQQGSSSEFVFAAPRSAGKPLSPNQVQHVLAANRRKLGVADAFTPHSIRHAALSWVAENGGSREIRDRLSNHTPPRDGADHIYVAASLSGPAREWTQRWVDYLASLGAENVVRLEEAWAG